jgi:capsular exopolysaccharide synthesis family protein
LVTLAEENSLAAEKFRLLRDRIRHQRRTRALQRIVVTSAIPGEGKTMVSMNLALSLAQHTKERVLLLEGDLYRPAFAASLGMEDFRGLGEWFTGTEAVTGFLYHLHPTQLWLLPAGRVPENPGGILQSARFLALYEQLTRAFDWILIDAPPLLPLADASFWSTLADGLLLVVREGKTPRKILEKGLAVLDNPRIVGVVLNEAQGVESSYYEHYYPKATRRPATALYPGPGDTPPDHS